MHTSSVQPSGSLPLRGPVVPPPLRMPVADAGIPRAPEAEGRRPAATHAARRRHAHSAAPPVPIAPAFGATGFEAAAHALADDALRSALVAVLDTHAHPAAAIGADGCVAVVNRAWGAPAAAGATRLPLAHAQRGAPATALLPAPPDVPDAVADQIEARLGLVRDGYVREVRLAWAYQPAGEERWVETRLARLGWQRRWILVEHRDVTAERRALLGGSDQGAQLAHLARIRTMGALAASLAHELSQPIAAIRTNAQAARFLLDSPRPDTAELRAILADIERDDERAGGVLTRLRALMRNEPPTRTAIPVAALAADAAELAAGEARVRRTPLDVDVPPWLPPVLGDRVQLLQVLLNLVLNAMDAVADAHGDDRRVVLRARIEAGHVRLSVLDRGRGLPAGDPARVFEPFFTTKASGIGVGLWIARAIADAHGGRLWCENARDRGAAFHLDLPLAPPLP